MRREYDYDEFLNQIFNPSRKHDYEFINLSYVDEENYFSLQDL